MKSNRKLGYVHAGANIAYSDPGTMERAWKVDVDLLTVKLDCHERGLCIYTDNITLLL